MCKGTRFTRMCQRSTLNCNDQTPKIKFVYNNVELMHARHLACTCDCQLPTMCQRVALGNHACLLCDMIQWQQLGIVPQAPRKLIGMPSIMKIFINSCGISKILVGNSVPPNGIRRSRIERAEGRNRKVSKWIQCELDPGTYL